MNVVKNYEHMNNLKIMQTNYQLNKIKLMKYHIKVKKKK